MSVIEPLPRNVYSAFIRCRDMGVIEALASKGRLVCFRYFGV
jgi:hypothetical protein